jgi:hypothetical protein
MSFGEHMVPDRGTEQGIILDQQNPHDTPFEHPLRVMHQADINLNVFLRSIQVDVRLRAHVSGHYKGNAMSAIRLIILSGSLLAFAVPASASPRCKAPLDTWQPREALEKKLRDEGWQIRRIKTDDGCYKVEGVRADGQRVKATFQPDTLILIREKTRDD